MVSASPTHALGKDVLEPLAIISYALEYPQDANNPEGFWRVLTERRNVMTKWPRDRLNLNAFYHQDGKQDQQKLVPGAHFLKEDLGAFDASFFGISAIEAMAMDVQQRKLLETTYHALENAGIPMEKIFGSKTGVYSGTMADDYQQVLVSKDIDSIPKYSASGVARAMVANRLSWFYNLCGPSICMDSACSSSLMAFDFACQGLRNKDCNMAVVTGSSLAFAADGTLSAINMSFLSPHGLCHSFDSRADGYSRAEGFGVVLVKRLEDAIRDGDPIRAIVRSNGSNQDGRTPGVTQPSREMQAALIRETYNKAGLDFSHTRFVEAHGTGTPLGDPIEAEAIGSVFRSFRSKEEPLYVGALKSNIGHLEGGSGVAGVIKAIMVLEKGIIPPNAIFETVNLRIDADFLNLKFPLECTPWPCSGLRRASVASFGFGGSNSHVVLDDAYHYMAFRGIKGTHYTSITPSIAYVGLEAGETHHAANSSPGMHVCMSTNEGNETIAKPKENGLASFKKIDEAQTQPHKLLVLSANDEKGVERLAAKYQEYFQNHQDALREQPDYVRHMAHTLCSRRSTLPCKSFAVIDSVECLTRLSSLIVKPLIAGLNAKTVFVFTGQGAQYHKMGAGLLASPSFKRTIERFDEELTRLGCTWSVSSLLLQQDEEAFDIHDPEYSQSAATALQMGAYDLLQDIGVKVALVVGHSSGEIAAAYAAGALSLRSACRVSYFRGKCASTLKRDMASKPGAMMSVELSESEARRALASFGTSHPGQDVPHIACINSSSNVTVSGDEASIDLIQVTLTSQQVHTRKLSTGVAYHSPHMQAIAKQYAEKIGSLEPDIQGLGASQADKRPIMISSVSGQYIDDITRICTSEYWVQNLLSPVQFSAAMSIVSAAIGSKKTRKLGQPKLDVQDVVEIGPHSALRRPILECLDSNGVHQPRARYHNILSRGQPAVPCLLDLVGRLYTRGYHVRVQEANEMHTGHATKALRLLPDLPSYPFNHTKSYWGESAISKHARLRNGVALHELLGIPVPDWNPLAPRWRKFFDVSETPWIGHHQVNGKIIYPAAGMIAMAIEGATQVADHDSGKRITAYQIRDAAFIAPISISKSERTEAQLHMRLNPAQSDQHLTSFDFGVYSAGSNGWFQNCGGTIQVLYNKVDGLSGGQAAVAARQRESLYYQQRYSECAKNSVYPVPTRKMYAQLWSNGLQFGPAFQSLDDMAWDGKSTAVGLVRHFPWKSGSELSHHDWQPHVVHPTVLDGAGHLPWVALTKGGEEQIVSGTAVTRIQYAWIASTGLSHPGAGQLRVCCETSLKGTRGTDSSIFALDAQGNLLLRIAHLETTALGGEERSELGHYPKEICYQLSYQPDLDFLGAKQLETLLEAGQESLDETRISFYEDLELALFYFATSSLQGGANVESLKGKPHIAKYVSWLRRQLDKYRSGDLPHGRPDWAVRIQDRAAMENLVDRLDKTNAEGQFFASVGHKLSSIIDGTTDPLEIMFETGLAEKHYQSICDQMMCCRPMKNYLALLSHKNPQLKLIEVGAGTGSITGHVLEGLGTRFSQYDYTDISVSFFEQAQRRFFYHAAKMHYSVLDIEMSPGEQGFVPHSYDVVVAAWVLHATQDLTKTLSHIRELLKPGGKLILGEITEPELLRNGFAFGTLPGWWLGTEPEREWSPCLSEAQWAQALANNGFSGVDVALPDYKDDTCHEHSILIATAVEDHGKCNGSTIARDEITLVTTPRSSLQEAVARNLKACLEHQGYGACSLVSIDDPALAQRTRTVLLFLIELDAPYLSSLDAVAFKSLQHLLSQSRRVLWVNSAAPSLPSSAQQHMVRGLSRVLFTEKPGLVFATLAFESVWLDIEAYSRLTTLVFSKTFAANDSVAHELEYVERDGTLHNIRIFDAEALNQEVYEKTNTLTRLQTLEQSPPLTLSIPKTGLLDSIRWEEDAQHADELDANQVEIQIQAVGVNFRDLLVMLGKYSASTVGCECAGVVTRVGTNCQNVFVPGDRVCAFLIGCSRMYARCHYKLAVKIPEFLSITEAASLPCTGVTAYHSLITLAQLKREDSILIHSATGGVGQMAVQIAKSVGAEIFVTVGNDEKRRLVGSLYGIPDDHIFSSRDVQFARDICRMTNERGVDVVLNSLSKEALLASWECIAPFGRFVELGKMDIESNSKLPMVQFSKNVAFYAVAVDHLSSQKPAVVGNALLSVIDMMEKGLIKVASPLQTYAVSQLEDALRFMQSGKNTGKMVLTFSPLDTVQASLKPRYSCSFDPNASYLIAGGLGGLGRSAARWMVSQGARNLILLSRSGPTSTPAQILVHELRTAGVEVSTPRCDVSDAASLASAIAFCADMPPIKGCLQATMVLQDSLFETMTWEQWSIATRAKVPSTWNLHKQLPKGLSFFVMLSSFAGVAGSMGQSNYAAGNTFQDGLAAHRSALGEKAVSIDLGYMEDIGVVAENAALARGKEAAADLSPIFETEFLALLDHFCDPSLVVSSEQAQPVIGLVTPAQFRKKGLQPPDWLLDRPLFRGLCQEDNQQDIGTNATDRDQDRDWVSELRCAAPGLEATNVVVDALVQKLSRATSTPAEEIDCTRPLHSYGVDSLLAVELRNWFGKLFKADVAIFDITGQGSIQRVAEGAASSSALLKTSNGQEQECTVH